MLRFFGFLWIFSFSTLFAQNLSFMTTINQARTIQEAREVIKESFKERYLLVQEIRRWKLRDIETISPLAAEAILLEMGLSDSEINKIYDYSRDHLWRPSAPRIILLLSVGATIFTVWVNLARSPLSHALWGVVPVSSLVWVLMTAESLLNPNANQRQALKEETGIKNPPRIKIHRLRALVQRCTYKTERLKAQ